MNISKLMSILLIALGAFFITSCNQDTNTDALESVSSTDTLSTEMDTSTGLKVAFVYGDTINRNYKFLQDVDAELEKERTLIDERLRRKLQRAEQRAGELQQRAQFMTQAEMQEAQIEMQGLEIELQQFEQKLMTELREHEFDMQKEYIDRINEYLETYNADGTYDIILNFQQGGNLLWMNAKFDVTYDVLEGLNVAYDAEVLAKETEDDAKTAP